MTSGGVLVLLFLLGLGGLSVTTLVIAARGGRGPGDPPASHARVDPAGFFVLSEPRGIWLRRHRPAAAGSAAASRTVRESRTAREMSPAAAGRPLPGVGRSSTRLP